MTFIFDNGIQPSGGGNPQDIEDLNKAVFPPTKIYNIGIEGTLTNNNGILSGFTRYTNYALTNKIFNPNSSAWKLVIKFLTPKMLSGNQYILGREYFFDLYTVNGVLSIDIGNGTVWTATGQSANSSLNTNRKYYAFVEYDGNQYKIGYSTNKDSWTEIKTISDNTIQASQQICIGDLIGGNDTLGSWAGGEIDLNETYIDIDNERWWSGVSVNGTLDKTQTTFYTKEEVDELIEQP